MGYADSHALAPLLLSACTMQKLKAHAVLHVLEQLLLFACAMIELKAHVDSHALALLSANALEAFDNN